MALVTVLLTAPGWDGSHTHHAPATPPVTVLAALRHLAVAAIAVVAGSALLRPLAGAPTPGCRNLTRMAATVAAVSPVMAIGIGGALPPPLAGMAVLTLALPPLLSRAAASAAAGALSTAALATYLATTLSTGSASGVRSVVDAAAVLLQGVAAVVWTGSAGHLATARAEDRDRTTRRLLPAILASTAALTAATLARLTNDGPPPSSAAWAAILAADAILAGGGATAATVVWLRRSDRPMTRARGRSASRWVGLAVTGFAGAALVAMPPPAVPPAPGVPFMDDIAAGGRLIPVLVAPARPGWNLVHVGADRAYVGSERGRLTAAAARPGTGNIWAQVWLPAGRSRLWVKVMGTMNAVQVDTGPRDGRTPDLRGSDGPECASVALGRILAGATGPLRSCPADRLTAADAAALRATVRFVAARGARTLGLVADSSPRSRQAATIVRAAARHEHITVAAPGRARIPLMVVAGWGTAYGVVRDVGTGSTTSQGTYLAPWLLNTSLLVPPAGQLLPLRFPTGDPAAVKYIAELSRRFPGEPASAAGYTAWLKTAREGPIRLYAASPLLVPGIPDHHHPTGAWLPQGSITAITSPLAE
ncbi:hypothetical protein [Actinomadura citrea]|uniref:Uncharacterized protein n=1 Tax=Actinomadura citrea TaxID=46158 RepID=A0A7Y9KEZ4_9ACTN|nr:hypothetical protein [Actinomadura citrea]NYE13134.1 hypothetical protein [Actinomadura citrea]GGU09987.1 hypothetical protein GCM10010177_81180 [Actinomadura citrea]